MSSDRSAAASAWSGVRRIMAFTRGSHASLRASTDFATSTGESLRARYSAASSVTLRKPISFDVTLMISSYVRANSATDASGFLDVPEQWKTIQHAREIAAKREGLQPGA